MICVVILETREQTVSSGCECFCSSDVELTALEELKGSNQDRVMDGLVQEVPWGFTFG